MIAGHAFSRALRAHIFSFTAISIIISKSMDNSVAVEEFFQKFFDNWNEEPTSTIVSIIFFFKHLTEEFIQKLNYLKSKGTTSKLWIQYFKCVTIAFQFIEAERLGN